MPDVTILDGAWGTELQARGLAIGECPDEWNLSHPEQVTSVGYATGSGWFALLAPTSGAARLETLTKELKCTIILSREVIERAGLPMPTVQSHRVRIKNVTAEIEMIAFRTQADLDDMILSLDHTS